MNKVFIMSSVHHWNDNRILYKEAVSLANKYQVELHALSDFAVRKEGNVIVYGLPGYKKRFLRPLNWLRLLYRAIRSKAPIIHFHDPELIPLGLLLKLLGRKVVFDVHEDYSDAILHKQWIPGFLRGATSKIYDWLGKRSCAFFDALIFAEKTYKGSFTQIPVLKEDILNYPLILVNELTGKSFQNSTPTNLVYAGSISDIRGATQMIEVINLLRGQRVDVFLYLVGPINQPGLGEKINLMIDNYALQDCVVITGRVAPADVYDYYSRADIGLALLYPVENNRKSLVTKLYEYMSAGLPVVASDFPLWKEFFAETGAGITVDPFNPEEITKKIMHLINQPPLLSMMSHNGIKACRERFNWRSEEKKLWHLYEQLMAVQRNKSSNEREVD